MLGDSIRQARIASGMSQEQLAERLGVSRQSISLWETNQTRPTAENIISIAKILGVSTDDLLLDENRIWSKSSYKETEEPDSEQKEKNPIQKKYIAIIFVFAALILLSGIGIGLLMGRDRNKDDISPTHTQSETIRDKESTNKENEAKSEADKDINESEENDRYTNGQPSDNNYNASTVSSTQGKEKATEKQTSKKDSTTEKQTTKKESATEKTTKTTTTAKKELTADEVAEIINNATSKTIDDSVVYSLTRTCELTEEPSFSSKDTLDKIVNGVSSGKTTNDVVEEILNTGTCTESVLSGKEPSNPTYALMASKIKGDDITSFEVNGNSYTLYLRNSSNPVRTYNVPLSRMTNCFITKEEINNYVSKSTVSVNDYSSENTNIKVTAKINGKRLNELEISYNTVSTMNIKVAIVPIKGQVNYSTSIRYYDFLF